MGGRVTLADVGAHAGVSRALVSIVMRGAPGASAATRARVLATARELGYRPDARARSLASTNSRFLGVMFGVDGGSYQFELLDGLYAAADAHGHHLLLSPLTRRRDEHRAVQSLHDFRFDGLIMLGPPTPQPELAGTVPIVVVGWHVDDPRVDVVRTSDDHGMAQAVGHLVELGHQRIAHIDGGDSMISTARRDAYRAAMTAEGLDAYVRVVRGGQNQLEGQHAARQLLESGELPTAVVAYNDDTAVAAMGLLAQHGVAVPDDLSMIGWDDNQAAALSPVSLTSVAQPTVAMARQAVDRLVARIEDRATGTRDLVLEPTLRIRSSTAPPTRRSVSD